MHTKLQELENRLSTLTNCESSAQKIAVLDQSEKVQQALQRLSFVQPLLSSLESDLELILKSLLEIGQEALLEDFKEDLVGLTSFLKSLLDFEAFYAALGGVVGYQFMVLKLFSQKKSLIKSEDHIYHPPKGFDISQASESVCQDEGLDALPLFAELYPIGGAADRLNLSCHETQEGLPAAMLEFCGHTLLEWLIRDVQAREYLYFKKWGKQLTTPLALMVSSEKQGYEHIVSLCEQKGWFGRGKESFYIFSQPLVPTVDLEGNWCRLEDKKLLMKPGGHGVIWKVAEDQGVFEWMKNKGRTKLLVRQINNPLAGIDSGLLAFCGRGVSEGKQFGFASCSRRVGSAEGMNVLVEKAQGDKKNYCLTSIEYCDFAKFGVADEPAKDQTEYSCYPSNTNILFADIEAVQKGLKSHPIPGMLVNAKPLVTRGAQETVAMRLESTMQNLADIFESEELETLPTFLTYHKRHKTISAIKRMWREGRPLLETPEGCLYDWLLNAQELLKEYCGMQVPRLPSFQEFAKLGPPFLLFYHPALGPQFSLIAEKIKGGVLHEFSELKLEIADLHIEGLDLLGALHIEAENVMGELTYSDRVGGCVLKHVKIENRGRESWDVSSCWKSPATYDERCRIEIQGNGQFYAEGVTLKGSQHFQVPSGVRMTLFEENGNLKIKETLINSLSP